MTVINSYTIFTVVHGGRFYSAKINGPNCVTVVRHTMAKLPLLWPSLKIGEIYVYKKIKLPEEKPFALAVSDIAKMHMYFLTKLRQLPDLSFLLYQHQRTRAHSAPQSPPKTFLAPGN